MKVDLDDLCWAYEDAYLGNSYYLDIEMGEVLFFSDNLTGTESGPEGIEEIEDEVGARYIALPRTSPREGYRDMEEFIEMVEDEDLKEKLDMLLSEAIDLLAKLGILSPISKEDPPTEETVDTAIEEDKTMWT